MATDPKLVEALRGTAEIYGRQLSAGAAAMFLADLARFSSEQILKALARCRSELRNFPTVADIAQRIDDGRPGPEEAWAMIPKDEAGSVVWTEEMADAFASCRELLATDPVGARMAFRERYAKLLADARANATPAKWSPSLGHDVSRREQAIQFAVIRGYLPASAAQNLLPVPMPQPKSIVLLKGPETPADQTADAGQFISSILSQLKPMPGSEVEKVDDGLTEEQRIENRRRMLREQARIIQGGA